jgi:hypothetical protein
MKRLAGYLRATLMLGAVVFAVFAIGMWIRSTHVNDVAIWERGHDFRGVLFGVATEPRKFVVICQRMTSSEQATSGLDEYSWGIEHHPTTAAVELPDTWHQILGFGYGDAGDSQPVYFRTHMGNVHTRTVVVFCPIWSIILDCLMIVTVQFRNLHRPQPGHCRRCGYDLRATPERCPECGEPSLTQTTQKDELA